MNAEETEIFDFLKQYPRVFVSVIEISKSVGSRRNFLMDKTWARPMLRRMEMEGVLESNPSGEYRLKDAGSDTTTFLKAMHNPDAMLGDTTIITLDDVQDDDEEDEKLGKTG